jgi:hypothetical protein
MRAPLTQDDVDDVVMVARQEAVVGNGEGSCRTRRMADLGDLRGHPFGRPPDVQTAGRQGPDPTVDGPGSEMPLQELSPPHAEGPVLTGIADDAHDQVTRGEPGGLLEPRGQPGVESTLLLRGAPLLEHLQHHEVVGALDTRPVSSQIS